MHLLHVFGKSLEDKAAIIGAIRNIPDQCRLVCADDEDMLAEFVTNKYTGELLEAPPGSYILWGAQATPLLIGNTKIILGTLHLLTRDTPRKQGVKYVPQHVLSAFRELLATSEKRLIAYEGDGEHDRKYLHVWPTDKVPLTYPSYPNYNYVGKVDLTTGEIG